MKIGLHKNPAVPCFSSQEKTSNYSFQKYLELRKELDESKNMCATLEATLQSHEKELKRLQELCRSYAAQVDQIQRDKENVQVRSIVFSIGCGCVNRMFSIGCGCVTA